MRTRLRQGRQVRYFPTAAEVSAFGEGPYSARIKRVNDDGSVDLAIDTPTAERETQLKARGTVTANVLSLADGVKCARVLRAFAVAGTATGEKTPDIVGAAPAAGEAAPTNDGDIAFNGTDAVTEAEVLYEPFLGTVYEETLAVAANSAALPSNRQALCLLEAEVLAGTDPGAKTVVARGAAPADNQAGLALDGASVAFAGADGATSARLKYVAAPGVGDQPAASISTKTSVSLSSEPGGFDLNAGSDAV